jgi:hypothetical protein
MSALDLPPGKSISILTALLDTSGLDCAKLERETTISSKLNIFFIS